MRPVLAEHCMHRLQRPQREGAQPHEAPQEGMQALDLLLGLERGRAVEAPEAAIGLLAQLHAHAPHGQLVGSIEQRKEVGLQQRAQQGLVVMLVVQQQEEGRP